MRMRGLKACTNKRKFLYLWSQLVGMRGLKECHQLYVILVTSGRNLCVYGLKDLMENIKNQELSYNNFCKALNILKAEINH